MAHLESRGRPARQVRFAVIFAIILAGCASGPKKKELSNVERAQLLVSVATGALIEGDSTGALEQLGRAEAEDPKNPEIYHARALAYFLKKNMSAALEQVQIALKLAPSYSDANNTYGKILMELGRYSEAVEPLKKAASDPVFRDSFKASTNLGILYYREGQLAKAKDSFNQAVDNAGDSACIAFYYLGHLSLRESNYKEAIRNYTRATHKMCAGFADGQYALGLTYERNHQLDLARRTYLEVQQHFPNTHAADEALSRLRELP